ncbi:MAG: Verru_Chthon cassette protein A, partial [Chthoniobacter sp.]|nr:Verru_Chthon cassette protein A [Chthoniobacter sp.]
MPVKWLYILKDGTLVPAKAAGTAGDVEVVVPPARQKTAQGDANTVVGRVAFWTDDETAKVNINTASEGTYWDTPVSNSQPGISKAASSASYKSSNDSVFEWDLAERQGAQKEYQRYPGHPATTCLSTVFGKQLLLKPEISGDRAAMAEEIFKFIPRVTGAEYDPNDTTYSNALQDNSSKAGTTRAGGASAETSVSIVKPDGERLYASIDEFLYNPYFDPASNVNRRIPWSLARPVSKRDTTREMLEMSKFFLTANSKAPEQNLFNLPRISVWPEQLSETRRTAFDKLIAFCSTVGPKSGSGTLPFYFTRQNGDSATADVTVRNKELMEYLRGLTERPIPGWDSTGAATKTFKSKYANGDRAQILTEIFDYIRCTNLADKSDPSVPTASFTQSTAAGPATYFPPNTTLGQSTLGQVVPIEMSLDGYNTRGFGRIATISELALVILKKDPAKSPPKLQVALIPKFFSPMAGFCAMANNFRVTFEDIRVTVNSKEVFKDFSGSTNSAQPTIYDIGRVGKPRSFDAKVGGTIGWVMLCELQQANPMPSPSDSVVPTAEMNAGEGSSLSIGGTVTVKISAPAKSTPTNSTNEPLVQTIKFKFPETTVPMPTFGEALYFTKDGTGTGSNQKGTGEAGQESRWYTNQSRSIKDVDTIRSLAAGGRNLQGDLRLIAARKEVSEDYFQPYNLAAYQDSSRRNRETHGLRDGWPWAGSAPGSAYGSLVAGMIGYDAPGQRAVVSPDLPAGINGVTNYLGEPGDWDTGPFIIRDGPLCNKADEGTTPHKADGVGGFGSTTPYIGDDYIHQDISLQSSTFFSPNRQIPSPVMLGSLPTGVMQDRPWQTLLFRPAKGYLPGGVNHPGSAKWGPPDHLLLDLFWMPVVEPYAISEPFATSGKINLNQQIAPFTNIKRDTGLRAVLKAVKITAMNPNQKDVFGEDYIGSYKLMSSAGQNQAAGAAGYGVINRRSIDVENTLKQISDRMERNKPFVSASEICDIPLIPQDVPLVAGLPKPMNPHYSAAFTDTTPLSSFEGKLKNFWEAHKLTGDNALEKPYAYIYPRLTTRSNSYTVHVRVQTLAQNTRNSSYILKASQSQPTGEFRGSFLLERYLDANSASIVDSAGTPKTVPASGDTTGLALGPYRFRVVSSKQFVP